MVETAQRIAIRVAGLSAVIGLFAGIAALVPSEEFTRWFGLVAFGFVLVATGWWASRDGGDIGTRLRDWLVIAFVLSLIWWVALTLFEGEHSVADRLALDFWSVAATVAFVFGAAIVGMVSAPRDRST